MAQLTGPDAGYDEFGCLHEDAAEAGLPFDHPPDTWDTVALALC